MAHTPLKPSPSESSAASRSTPPSAPPSELPVPTWHTTHPSGSPVPTWNTHPSTLPSESTLPTTLPSESSMASPSTPPSSYCTQTPPPVEKPSSPDVTWGDSISPSDSCIDLPLVPIQNELLTPISPFKVDFAYPVTWIDERGKTASQIRLVDCAMSAFDPPQSRIVLHLALDNFMWHIRIESNHKVENGITIKALFNGIHRSLRTRVPQEGHGAFPQVDNSVREAFCSRYGREQGEDEKKTEREKGVRMIDFLRGKTFRGIRYCQKTERWVLEVSGSPKASRM